MVLNEVLVAPDKFKGCLTAADAARLMAAGVRRALPRAAVRLMPLADGGDGTGDVLARVWGGVRRWARVRGPLGRPVRASWVWFPKKRIALVELARASGLWRLSTKRRNPLKTSTYGTGELIKAALKMGPSALWIAVGGSATVDGGAGMLQALGARLVMKNGRVLGRPAGGGDLAAVERLDLSGLAKIPAVTVLCDVDNPLAGPRGATRVFGPQKGATRGGARRLEKGLLRWAKMLRAAAGKDVLGKARMGAAGGAAAGLSAAFGARLVSGAEAVLDAAGFDGALRTADLVLTGEGAVDRTSAEGKIVGRAAARARRAGVPVVVVTGRRRAGWEVLLRRGVRAVEEIAPGASERESLRRARALLPAAAGRAVGG